MSESEGQKPADTETAWSKGKAEFTGKSYSKYFDPCEEAAQRSLKCLRRNGGDRLMCTDYFEAYKDCKKSWMDEMKEAKRASSKGWFS
ncbi:hypothetical protein B0A48_02599 [Cryoendolithus antarcticus]|uniref:Cytochrome c oxidase-assembly factor cox-23, mitochondrial n=1 Tax=Cryoendolithus antarcticus TaxID=1507870 RepID=A0A1V8TP45_9PEZI|nr:hypothetical protein B0A48_02599 [Cryoendolithus antarcticus]OQO20240.1 hypothetical protein B0A51_11973 [Rachicladosporium sp. CCFEE 5018]